MRLWGSRPYLLRRGRPPLSYQDFATGVARAKQALAAAGVGPGDHVALMLAAPADVLTLWLALNALGAAPAMVNTEYRGEVLATVLVDNCAAEWLAIDHALLPRLVPIAARLGRYRHLLVAGGAGWGQAGGGPVPEVPWPARCRPLESVLAGEPPSGAAPALGDRPQRDDLSVILATSGTTGPTKGVRCCHNHALHYAEVANAMRRLSETDVVYGYTPLFHADGLFANALGAMLAGAALLLAGPFHPRRFWRDVLAHGVTTFSYAGGMISMLYHQAPPPEGIAHRLRVAYGAPSPPHLARDFERRFGLRLVEGYGSTELGIPTFTPWEDSRVEHAAAGLPVTGYDVQVIGAAGEALPPGAPGQIVVRPRVRSMAMLGYHARPDLDARVWRDGWFQTGDLGRFDDGGHLYFLGRMTDSIRRRGESIACPEVEAAIERCPGVLEAAAFGVPAADGEEEVMVAVRVEAGGAGFDPQALVACARRLLPAFMVPRYVEVVADFERSAATSKVRKAPLIERGVTRRTWDARPAR